MPSTTEVVSFQDPVLGDVHLTRSLPLSGPRDYTLSVRAANPPPGARAATLPLHVTVVEPSDAPPRSVADHALSDGECQFAPLQVATGSYVRCSKALDVRIYTYITNILIP